MAFTWLNTTIVNYESSKLEGHRCNNNKSWCIKPKMDIDVTITKG